MSTLIEYLTAQKLWLRNTLINWQMKCNDDADHAAPGIWEVKIDKSRIINQDETPHFINYDVDGLTIS